MKQPLQVKQLILPDTSVWISYFKNRNAGLMTMDAHFQQIPGLSPEMWTQES